MWASYKIVRIFEGISALTGDKKVRTDGLVGHTRLRKNFTVKCLDATSVLELLVATFRGYKP